MNQISGEDASVCFDFEKIINKPARKYVHILVTDYYTHSYPMCTEHTFDIENKEDAYHIIKKFIMDKEKSSELIFRTGFCERHECVAWLLSDTCCRHRIASFNYEGEYTCITGYSDVVYKIQIIYG